MRAFTFSRELRVTVGTEPVFTRWLRDGDDEQALSADILRSFLNDGGREIATTDVGQADGLAANLLAITNGHFSFNALSSALKGVSLLKARRNRPSPARKYGPGPRRRFVV